MNLCRVGPPYPWVPHLGIQLTHHKYLGEKSSRNSWKAKVELATSWQLLTEHLYCIYSYLYSICTVLGITSNLEIKVEENWMSLGYMQMHCYFM